VDFSSGTASTSFGYLETLHTRPMNLPPASIRRARLGTATDVGGVVPPVWRRAQGPRRAQRTWPVGQTADGRSGQLRRQRSAANFSHWSFEALGLGAGRTQTGSVLSWLHVRQRM
jgi:hypothetical protein